MLMPQTSTLVTQQLGNLRRPCPLARHLFHIKHVCEIIQFNIIMGVGFAGQSAGASLPLPTGTHCVS